MVTQMANDDRLCVYESRPRMIVKTRDSQGKFGLTTRSQSILREAPRIKVSQIQDMFLKGDKKLRYFSSLGEIEFDEGLGTFRHPIIFKVPS